MRIALEVIAELERERVERRRKLEQEADLPSTAGGAEALPERHA
jgi:hypothetical protein